MKLKLIFYTLFLLIIPILSLSQEVLNTGLVKGLWLSDDKVFDGQETTINAIFYNNSDFDISGLVVFYDNKNEFFKKKASIKKDALEHIRVPYVVKSGKHYFESKIIEARRVENGEEKELVKPKNSSIVFGSKSIEFDFDTDGDKIGNKEDTDDDNDGYSDLIELKNGSDPLKRISTPKTVESLKKINEVTTEVKKASENIFSKINDFRSTTKNILENKILERKRQINNKNLEKENINDETEKISTRIFVGNDKQINKENRDPYLIILRIMLTIFNSIFLSILFFIFSVWLIYKIIKKIFFR